MPKKFKFEENNDEEWDVLHEEVFTASRCNGISKNGTRCKRTCIIGYEYCPVHLESIKQLKIKDSRIPNAGKGLFAYNRKKGANEIIFKKDETIIQYNGVLKSGIILENEYGDYTAPYAIEMKTVNGQTENIDAAGK